MSPNKQDRVPDGFAGAKHYAGHRRFHGPADICSHGTVLQRVVIGEDLAQRGTWAGLLTIRPTTRLLSATTEGGNINTTDSLKKGSPISDRATRKRVLSSPSPLSGLS